MTIQHRSQRQTNKQSGVYLVILALVLFIIPLVLLAFVQRYQISQETALADHLFDQSLTEFTSLLSTTSSCSVTQTCLSQKFDVVIHRHISRSLKLFEKNRSEVLTSYLRGLAVQVNLIREQYTQSENESEKCTVLTSLPHTRITIQATFIPTSPGENAFYGGTHSYQRTSYIFTCP